MSVKVSKQAFDEMTAQLKMLKTVRRKEIAKAIEEAREQGDLKENAGYHYARQEQSLNEARIKELEGKLEDVVIADDKDRQVDFVDIGSKVKYKNMETDRITEYTIVSDVEADIMQRKVSCDTPLGQALMGAKKGEVVEYEAPVGPMKIKVMEIS